MKRMILSYVGKCDEKKKKKNLWIRKFIHDNNKNRIIKSIDARYIFSLKVSVTRTYVSLIFQMGSRLFTGFVCQNNDIININLY